MNPSIVQQLLQINTVFYQSFGPAFAATRRRIQPGIRQVLQRIPAHGRWLDLGCGSGALALEWAAQGRSGAYVGLDFSASLLDEARQVTAPINHSALEINFIQAGLDDPDWAARVGVLPFDGAFSFAVLHHIPGVELRRDLLRRVRSLLPAGALFIHSVWQFQNSPKLLQRVVPWEKVNLDPAQLEPGDYLLDWRYALPGQVEQVGLRYVHRFERAELAQLALESGFNLLEEFESDGSGGRLGLYQIWQAV